MTPFAGAPLDTAQLEQALVAVDPAVCLVAPRILRRVIKADRRLVGLGVRVPHVKSYVIGRAALLDIAAPDELGRDPGREFPDPVVLLSRPEPDKLAALGRDEALVLYWRYLFHARVHQALDARLAERRLTTAGVRHRIQSLGATEFDAARAVLRQENFLMPPRDDTTAYVEFAALYLELRHFAPSLLPHYFPGLADWKAIDALLAEDVEAGALLAQTRPAGAPDPATVGRPNGAAPAARRPAEEAPPAGPPSDAAYRQLIVRADKARARGNVVRAAILRMEAAAAAQPKRWRAARNAARAELALLVDRLRPALGLSDDEARAWRQLLPSLLAPAARGIWPVEARLLYDLQKVCVDHERQLYAADLVEWVRSAFRRPIKRPLPEQRAVLLLKHLRGASRRLRTVRMTEDERQQLGRSFLAAIARKEAELRERFRPRIVGVLDEVELVPQNVPEHAARDKLVEELLDLVVDHGFSTMGDLRDGVARSQLKLPDLAESPAPPAGESWPRRIVRVLRRWVRLPIEVVRGDRLLRADKQLAVALDGVSRRGEVYRRLFQRVSSVAFGTPVGRFLTRYFALPFGGAYGIVVGGLHIVDIVAHYVFRIDHYHAIDVFNPLVCSWATRLTDVTEELPPPPGLSPKEAEHFHPFTDLERLLTQGLLSGALGLFLLALLHVPPFRRAVFHGVVRVYDGLRSLFLDLPHAVLHWPPLRRLLDSRAFAFVSRCLLKPALPAGLVGLLLWADGAARNLSVGLAAGVFVALVVLLNSRIGRALEEVVSDGLARAWQRLSLEIVPEVIHFVIDLFKGLLGAFDRVLYSVDEWLRFRSGSGRATFVAKALFGLVWFVVAYIVRLVVVLFVEPTFNPVKHFPTVTVTAKLILPFVRDWVPLFGAPLSFLGPLAEYALGTAVIFLIPGLAGFLVWELKENWRLYAANRPPTLRPVMVASHGETVVRLLRPGFHSGTLPKLHAKLRKAERRAARRPGYADTVRAHMMALHHLGEDVRHFFEREFLALLNASTFWRDTPLALGAVELGSNNIRAELACRALAPEPVWLAFEERSGQLLAVLTGSGWLARLTVDQRGALATALAGLYKLAGVGLVRQQIEAVLPAAVADYDMVDEGLWVSLGTDADAEAVYPLDAAGDVLVARVKAGSFPEPLPPLPAVPLLFERVELRWDWWVAAWEGDRAGQPHPPLPVPGLRLLPKAAYAPQTMSV